ncbi:hypothetical protein CAPTEDRAFT_212886 [Capitella teleta]|uniref:TBC1 domain family member 4 n=1 Tax=Capitella teleta TaxID=283909 RepID=R7TI11_CAPTE|nr:hypothetical protein CAPTEDRAFT_212886 [Capitella teleta]|eukprot:ELT93344.1 hypothetical protein CAPTEDRAFT_212886 [Capitella teleta]
MQTLKQAFQTAFQNTAAPVCSAAVSSALNKSHVVCELCPMHQLHKLCLEIDNHREVLAKLKVSFYNLLIFITFFPIFWNPENTFCVFEILVNECIMVTLRQMCEERQSTHVHLSDAPKGSTGKPEFFLSVACRQPPSMLDHLKQKAKKSLASSFDNLMRVRIFTSTGIHNTRYSQDLHWPLAHLWCRVYNIRIPVRVQKDMSQMILEFIKESSSTTSPTTSPPPSPVSDSPIAVTPSKQTSWRLDILNRVVTPARRQETLDEADGSDHVKTKMTPQKVRALWRKAILETLLLIRMERENKTLQARLDEVETKRQKLDYEEITPCLKEVTKVWDKMLSDPQRPVAHINTDDINSALKKGVPRSRRGEIWQLCVEQHRLRHHAVVPMTDNQRSSYEDLLKQLTVHQHAILIDLGRTFPAHPYFSTALGPGQLALFNLLKAYSLLDKEVGYCQGLSFVAGILLMHMPEERAFQTMKYIMFQLGFRRQYRPDMIALQIQMYQLSRLLHDYHRDLDAHLQQHDIGPTLYAAPWFLTIFASQFPLGFVARVYDLIFQQGLEVVFKVALVLLGNHKELIKQCDSFEANVEFLKTTLPSMGIIQMERVINQVFQMDLSQKLQAYEVEYHNYHKFSHS